MRRRGGVGAAAAEKGKEESHTNEVALRNLSSNRILTSLAPRLDLEQPVALAAFTAPQSTRGFLKLVRNCMFTTLFTAHHLSPRQSALHFAPLTTQPLSPLPLSLSH